ncbi:MAG: radical SAM protein [Candidatus Thermoplasmatota archaeon]|nr:radical SAM protein [Candidatus Thermoplasmatota archaeon]
MMLDRYRAILNGEIEPYYLRAKKQDLNTDYSELSREELWGEIDEFRRENKIPPLELKVELAKKMVKGCELCERKCKVNREKGEKGYCDVTEPKISSEFLHMGEERELVPSHTVFFAGCNFRCVFCQNYEISQLNQGRKLPAEILAEKIESDGGKNVNWVGGDPTPNLHYILEVLRKMKKPIPQIWNSNMYLSEKCMKLLSQLMDVYLTDFKYGNDECAKKLSDVEDYTFVLRRNHLIAEKTGDLIIRHLVLPGHLECCTKPLLEWIDSNLGNPKLNIMTQYRPVWHADEHPKIDRYLNREEKKEIKKLRKKYS